ncbi:ankyrin repeat and SAM domain-containing protein 3-like [Mizuhopecten yessoensis]|uniref:Ankyrin repeat and SAM domain-containing protein 3 n=1 Tax=Mizuhopecten yessoensis TaxID=6573 RepID=A0A210PR24_MIZYE|nr:ankyrin repeat and SAM domain-containing protein 3-like [Mizuhopecten yessoensis]OWF38943.1 Ankyrin repeat and SAM domain-containing protein 3 [Mizuhopecten yessoensis]
MASEVDAQYEASDESSENELLDKSLSVWKGWNVKETFDPIPLDLHTASSIGHYDCVRSFIQRKVDLNKKNRGGWTPLMYACYIGHDNIVNLLLDANVSVNIKNSKGQTPLMLASSCGNESVGYFICQQGAELEARDQKGWTALFHATYAGHQNMVQTLLEQGADINAVEPSMGITPFMEAAAEGHEIIVQIFLQHGVTVNSKAHNNDTARSLALIYGHIKIVSLIDNHSMPITCLRAEAGLDADLSSSDESFPTRRTQQVRRGKGKGGPSIRDGPDAIARLIDRSHPGSAENSHPKVPKGYLSFKQNETDPSDAPKLSFRDVTSPINQQDYNSALDSSGGKDSCADEHEEDGNAFSKTGALTIKSSSGSSGGLMAALGINRESSLDSDDCQPQDSTTSGTSSLEGSTNSLNGAVLSPASSFNNDLVTVHNNDRVSEGASIPCDEASLPGGSGKDSQPINSRRNSGPRDSKTEAPKPVSLPSSQLSAFVPNNHSSSFTTRAELATMSSNSQSSMPCLNVNHQNSPNNRSQVPSFGLGSQSHPHNLNTQPSNFNAQPSNFNVQSSSFTSPCNNGASPQSDQQQHLGYTSLPQEYDILRTTADVMPANNPPHTDNSYPPPNMFSGLGSNPVTCAPQIGYQLFPTPPAINTAIPQSPIMPSNQGVPQSPMMQQNQGVSPSPIMQPNPTMAPNSGTQQSSIIPPGPAMGASNSVMSSHPTVTNVVMTANPMMTHNALLQDQQFFGPPKVPSDGQPQDLPGLLDQLGLTRYLPVFEEQDVDLQVFLSLTDADLKEIGIKLFGPRKKMTNAIARWHNRGPICQSSLEQAYADRLDTEMQDMGLQLRKSFEQIETLKAQVLQEQRIRNVTESCLTDIQQISYDTRQQCEEMKESLRKLKHFHTEIKIKADLRDEKRNQPIPASEARNVNDLASAMREDLSLDDRTRGSANDKAGSSADLAIKKIEHYIKALQKYLAMITMNADRLLTWGANSHTQDSGFS